MRALTGTDPDRLKEEKERGITIDLGFAHCELGEGVVASFVDVPGHERFVRHMLAGAHGIDAVALVVAADESVMPQTREHFHICRLLGVPRGLVVLTKCDAADADSQAIAELEARELVAGSFLESAPLVRVSARTGEGLPALREALLALARESPPRPSVGAAAAARRPGLLDEGLRHRGHGDARRRRAGDGRGGRGAALRAPGAGARPAGARRDGRAGGGRDAHRREPGRRGRGARPRRGAGATGHAAGDLDDRRRSCRSCPGPARSRTGRGCGSTRRAPRCSPACACSGPRRSSPGEARSPSCGSRAPPSPGAGIASCCAPTRPPTRSPAPLVVDPLPPRRRTADRPAVERLRDAVGLLGAAEAMVAEAGAAGIDAPLLAARLTVPLARLTAEILGERLDGRSRTGPRGGRLPGRPRAAGGSERWPPSRSSTGRTRSRRPCRARSCGAGPSTTPR